MTISQRARAKITEMPEREQPLSEQFRIAAKAWVEAERLAQLAEDLKSSKLAQMMMAYADMPVSRAEMTCKASQDWRDYIEDMVSKRAEANLAKVKMEWLRMVERETDRTDWAQRTERKMARTAT